MAFHLLEMLVYSFSWGHNPLLPRWQIACVFLISESSTSNCPRKSWCYSRFGYSYQSYSDFFTVLPPSLFLLLLSFVQWWVHRLGIFSTALSYCLNPFVLCFSLLVAMPLIRIILVWKSFFIHRILTILRSCFEIKDEIPRVKSLINK